MTTRSVAPLRYNPVNQHGHNPVNQHGHNPVKQHGHDPFTQHGHNPFTQYGHNSCDKKQSQLLTGTSSRPDVLHKDNSFVMKKYVKRNT